MILAQRMPVLNGEPHETLSAAGSPATAYADGGGPVAEPVGGTTIMRRVEMPLALTATYADERRSRPVVQTSIPVQMVLPVMPLVKTAQRTPSEAGPESPGVASDRLASSAVSGYGSGQTAGPQGPTGEPAAGRAGMLKLEGPELERVANEVYAIIERRLEIERESLGL